MKIEVYRQTEEVADRRRAQSAQPRHATADLPPQSHSPARPHPNSAASAFGTTGAPQKGLLFAPLSAHSQKHTMFVRKTQRNARQSR
jgi:hypothetical protein